MFGELGKKSVLNEIQKLHNQLKRKELWNLYYLTEKKDGTVEANHSKNGSASGGAEKLCQVQQ